MPTIIVPVSFDFRHYYGGFGGAHALLFSKNYREQMLNDVQPETVVDWDMINFSAYMYHEPLCFQLFPETENQSNWGHDHWFYNFFSILIKMWVHFLGVDKNYNGYYYQYFICKTVFVILSLFILISLILVLWLAFRIFFCK
jgi:hypothetical protein